MDTKFITAFWQVHNPGICRLQEQKGIYNKVVLTIIANFTRYIHGTSLTSVIHIWLIINRYGHTPSITLDQFFMGIQEPVLDLAQIE